MQNITHNYQAILNKIRLAEKKYHRAPNSVSCLAVSKTFAPEALLPIIAIGQHEFAENYLQEALPKISALSGKNLVWHFIGPIQTNKCKEIAYNFSWVHTIFREKEADQLSMHRPQDLAPLQVCIQIKLDNNSSTKNGLLPHEALRLAKHINQVPNLRLRGLMAIPPISTDFQQQRQYFKLIKNIGHQLSEASIELDTFSMGMTHDLEAAIAEGATIVRIGQGIFGARA